MQLFLQCIFQDIFVPEVFFIIKFFTAVVVGSVGDGVDLVVVVVDAGVSGVDLVVKQAFLLIASMIGVRVYSPGGGSVVIGSFVDSVCLCGGVAGNGAYNGVPMNCVFD